MSRLLRTLVQHGIVSISRIKLHIIGKLGK